MGWCDHCDNTKSTTSLLVFGWLCLSLYSVRPLNQIFLLNFCVLLDHLQIARCDAVAVCSSLPCRMPKNFGVISPQHFVKWHVHWNNVSYGVCTRSPSMSNVVSNCTTTHTQLRQDDREKKTDSAIRMIYMRNEENKNDAWYDQNDHSKWAGCVGDKLCSSIWPYTMCTTNGHIQSSHIQTSWFECSTARARRSWIWICDDKSITHCERIRSWMRMPCIHK